MPVQKPSRDHNSWLRKHRQSFVDCSRGPLLKVKVKVLEFSIHASCGIKRDGVVPREGRIQRRGRY